MRIVPIFSCADFRQQWHGQYAFADVGHPLRQLCFDVRQFIFRHLQHQFVVHLHDQLGGRLLGGQSSLHLNHGAFDEIGSSALHRCVNGGAFGGGTADGAAVDVGQIQAAAEQGFHIAQTARLYRAK